MFFFFIIIQDYLALTHTPSLSLSDQQCLKRGLAVLEATRGRENPLSYLVKSNMGVVYEALGKHEEAGKAYADALRMRRVHPSYPLVTFNYARLSALSNIDQAAFYFKKVRRYLQFCSESQTLSQCHEQITYQDPFKSQPYNIQQLRGSQAWRDIAASVMELVPQMTFMHYYARSMHRTSMPVEVY